MNCEFHQLLGFFTRAVLLERTDLHKVTRDRDGGSVCICSIFVFVFDFLVWHD